MCRVSMRPTTRRRPHPTNREKTTHPTERRTRILVHGMCRNAETAVSLVLREKLRTRWFPRARLVRWVQPTNQPTNAVEIQKFARKATLNGIMSLELADIVVRLSQRVSLALQRVDALSSPPSSQPWRGRDRQQETKRFLRSLNLSHKRQHVKKKPAPQPKRGRSCLCESTTQTQLYTREAQHFGRAVGGFRPTSIGDERRLSSRASSPVSHAAHVAVTAHGKTHESPVLFHPELT